MFKPISILIIICFAAFGVSAQAEKYTAPVKWERYKVGDKDVSLLLPKLPVLLRRSNVCLQQETSQYAVYADEIVYGLTVNSKSHEEIPFYCREKSFFDEARFENRLVELKARLKTSDETKFTQNGREIIKVEGVSESVVYWLIDDFENKMWYELWISGQNHARPEVKNFVESIETGKNTLGIEIGEGASRTLGDENVADTIDISAQDKDVKTTEKEEIQKIKIVIKPIPGYTDKARNEKTQGIVRLRVTFSANGGIKTVAVEKDLKNGLTEQAIAAAMKMVFIPVKKNGKPVTASKLVEYSFALH